MACMCKGRYLLSRCKRQMCRYCQSWRGARGVYEMSNSMTSGCSRFKVTWSGGEHGVEFL